MDCNPTSIPRAVILRVSGETAPGIISPILQRVYTSVLRTSLVSSSRGSGSSWVMGRACSHHKVPFSSMAHSKSRGWPHLLTPLSASSTRVSTSSSRRIGISPVSSETTMRPLKSVRIWSGVLCPETSASPSPATASTTTRSRRPVTGSAVKRTPAALGAIMA